MAVFLSLFQPLGFLFWVSLHPQLFVSEATRRAPMHQNGPTVISWINCGGKHLEFGVGKIYLKVKCVWVFFYLELSMGATRVGNVAGNVGKLLYRGSAAFSGSERSVPGRAPSLSMPPARPLAHRRPSFRRG